MTFTAPFVDTSTGYGADTAGPVSFGAPFLDSGAGFAGLFLTSDGLDVYVGGAPFTYYRNLSFQDPRDDAGSFSFEVPRDLFTGIGFDDVVEVLLDGQPIFSGVIEGIRHDVHNQDETPMVNVTGRSLDALFDQAVVYPSRGVESIPIEDVRSFSWVAPDFDDSAWPLAKRINRQREYADWRSPLPWIWPDTAAWWIWANQSTSTSVSAPVGVCLFRQSFDLAGEETVKFFFAGDDFLNGYVDGAEVTTGGTFTTGRYVTMLLSAGTHYVAAFVRNIAKSVLPNPGGFIFAAYTTGIGGLLDELVLDSDADWSCLPYPSVMPGYTHGQVIRILVEEAQADDALDGVTLDFSDTVDSSGQAWGLFREITVQVGRSVLEVLSEMAGTYIEFEITAAKVLRVWNRGNRGTVRTAALQQTTDPATSDFVTLTHSGKRTRMNRVLIRYARGHLEETDTTSITAEGSRGAFLSLGAVRGEPEARKVAQGLMDNRAGEAFSTAAGLRPRDDTTTPYKAYGLADHITCPDHSDTPVSMQVLSIGFRQNDEDATIDWNVELQDPELLEEERVNNWLRRMSDGAVFGGAKVSSPYGTPAPQATDLVALDVAEFSYDNSELIESASPIRRSVVSGNLVEVVGQLTTAGSTTTYVDVYISETVSGGYVDNGDIHYLITFPAGVLEAETPCAIEAVRANVDKVQVYLTPGTGAEGLDVQVRAI